jgi:hypothetical protein
VTKAIATPRAIKPNASTSASASVGVLFIVVSDLMRVAEAPASPYGLTTDVTLNDVSEATISEATIRHQGVDYVAASSSRLAVRDC